MREKKRAYIGLASQLILDAKISKEELCIVSEGLFSIIKMTSKYCSLFLSEVYARMVVLSI